MRRPALQVSICFAFGIYLSDHFSCSSVDFVLVATVAMTLVLAGHLLHWPAGVQTALICVLFSLLGGACHAGARERGRPVVLLRAAAGGGRVTLAGRISEEPVRIRDEVRAIVAADELRSGDTAYVARGSVLVRFLDGTPGVHYGDRVRLSVRLQRPAPQRNPGGFDYRQFLARRRIWATASVRRAGQVLGVQPGSGTGIWSAVVLPVRRAVRKAVDRNLTGGPGGLLRGVLLGEKRTVPDDVREAFAGAGVNHVLAVSGLHVGLVGGCVLFGLRLLWLGRTTTCALTAVVLVGYAMVTGMPPSVLRAVGMGCLALLASMGSREGDGLNTLGLAGLGLLVARPQMLWDVGFQLSFSATASILLFHGPIRAWMGSRGPGVWRRWVAPGLAVSLAAQIGTAPLVAIHFGRLAPVSVVANFVVVPLMGAAVGLGMLSVLAAQIIPTISTWLNAANWVVLQAAIHAAVWFAAAPWASVEVPVPAPGFLALYLCLVPLLLPGIRASGWGRALVMLALVSTNVWVWSWLIGRGDAMEVWVLDVGNGDSILVRFPSGRTMLVDGGIRAGRRDAGLQVILPFMRSQGIDEIDVVVGTHPHNDHIGGLVTVLEQVRVGHYLDSGLADSTWASIRLAEAIRSRGIRYAAVAAGDSLAGLGVGALVLHPHANDQIRNLNSHQENSRSVVIRLEWKGRAVLLTGDIERDTDRDLARWGPRLKADLLKVAHHGSRTSSSPTFLDAVEPNVVAISCGRGNSYGHPSGEVVSRFKEAGMQVMRTDRDGAVVARFGVQDLVVSTWVDR